jgi:outer membrane protein OmpA-like peptidoglycan-associated protein
MSQGVDRLKELLFDTEARKLDELNRRLQGLAESEVQRHGELARRVDAVFERVGSEERMRKSVASVLDGAFRDAEIAKHAQLSEAVAPLVVSTIKFELRNSQDEMVDALYPITGRLVKQYVAAAVKDMMVQINSRLSVGFPGHRLAMRAKGLLTGTSMSELALAETQRLELEELFLIRRGSGELVAHWEQSAAPKSLATPTAIGANRDALIPPYLVAINAFAEDAFSADTSAMRTLDMGDSRIYLRSSSAYLLAAKCSGMGPAAVEQIIDEQFLSALTEYKNALAAPARGASLATKAGTSTEQTAALARILPGLARTLDQRLAEKHAELAPSGSGSFAPLYTIAALIFLPLIGWVAWSSWQNWQAMRTREAVQAVLGSIPEISSYPIQIDVDRGGRGYALTGLAPSGDVRDRLVERLRTDVAHAQARDRIAAVTAESRTDLEAIAALRRSLANVETELWRAPIRRAIDRAGPRIAPLNTSLERIAPSLPADTDRATLTRAITALKAAEGAASNVQRGVAANGATKPSLTAPLSQLRAHLATAEASLASLADTNTEQATSNVATDPVEIAEDIALIVERLNLLSVTLERTGPLKPLQGQVATLRQRLDNLKFPDAPSIDTTTPRDRLSAFARANAIFFANNSDYLDDKRATTTLDELTQLTMATDAIVRVVGYTDERGSQGRNTNLAISRAQRIAAELQSRGVPANRIVAVGRTTGYDLNPGTGIGSPNRRVEFEIGFIGEPNGR